MSLHTISVVMGVYNGANCLRTALDSVFAQTRRDLEFIIVNDGSTDETGEILDGYAKRDARLRVLWQENQGLTRALIRGCAASRGELIARQDADDWSHPDRLKKQAELLAGDARVGFVSCWTQYIGPEDEPLEVIRRPADSQLATRQLLDQRQGPPAHGSVMFRRSLYEQVGGYRPEFYYAQDSDLWLRMAERARIAYVPEVLYQWRRDFASISGGRRPLQRRFGGLGQACRAARQRSESEEALLAEARELSRQLTDGPHDSTSIGQEDAEAEMAYLIGSRLARDGDRRAAKYLWRTIRRRPWHWRAWVRLIQVRMLPGSQRSEAK